MPSQERCPVCEGEDVLRFSLKGNSCHASAEALPTRGAEIVSIPGRPRRSPRLTRSSTLPANVPTSVSVQSRMAEAKRSIAVRYTVSVHGQIEAANPMVRSCSGLGLCLRVATGPRSFPSRAVFGTCSLTLAPDGSCLPAGTTFPAATIGIGLPEIVHLKGTKSNPGTCAPPRRNELRKKARRPLPPDTHGRTGDDSDGRKRPTERSRKSTAMLLVDGAS